MKLLIIFLFIPVHLLSQDLSGTWTGILQTKGNDLYYELVISEDGKKVSGYALTIFTINGVENVGVKSVMIKKKKGDLYIEDDKMIYDNYSTQPKRVKMFATLTPGVQDSLITLSGKFRTRLVHHYSPENSYYAGNLILTKHRNFEDSRLLFQLDRLNLAGSLSFINPKGLEKRVATIARPERTPMPLPKETITEPVIPADIIPSALFERKTEIIRNISFRSDSLVLNLYDNGTIDGDTVSVLLNKKIILFKKALTLNPLRLVIQMTPDLGDSILLIMHAENLGLIAPNTGLLVIQDGNDRSEIRFEGNLQKSSGVMLRRNKK